MIRKLVVAALVVALLQAPAARAVEAKDVQDAVDRGVRWLQSEQSETGVWNYTEIGATALAAVTLLECGVPASDPSIVKATLALRRASIGESHTYSVALLIIFFDRLGDANDVPLIESLTIRLLAGQNPDGGWGYNCPGINGVEARRLMGNAGQEKILVSRRDKEARRTVEDMPREIRAQLEQVQQDVAVGFAMVPGVSKISDNSNTQFATLALWIARRHGFPVEKAVARIEQRFRRTQNADGGWGYNWFVLAGAGNTGGALSISRPSMTCAGILALAVANGTSIEKGKNKEALARAAKQDRSIQAGLLALGTVIGEPTGDVRRAPEAGGGSYYFLWSLERIAVALGMDTIGKKDWYNWGAEIILANQQSNGRWMGAYGHYGADTCFALLFLKRANFAEDLTRHLRGNIADPGRVLRGQGMRETSGGRMKSALDPKGAKGPPSGSPGKPDAAAPAVKLTGLAAELAEAEAEKREELLARYRDGKGVKYTEQLAAAIVQLEGDLKQKARHALADRLTRMKVETLEGYLEDEDTEIRRAAALAVAMKDARTLTPRLIGLLEDAQPTVARAAHAALKSLSGKDFGPQQGASAEERQKAVQAWRDWWQQGGK